MLRVLLTLPFCFLKKRRENHNSIASNSPTPEAILLWTQHAVSLDNIIHLLAHPGGDEPQQVGGDSDWPVKRNMKSKVTSLITNDLPVLSGIERITTLVNQNTFANVHIRRNNASQDYLVKKPQQMFLHFIGYPIIPTYLSIRQVLQHLV